MYRIGEFSKLSNLSIRTLRFYNELGILIPEEVDVFSNYRYYSDHNLKEAKMIESLKNAGFSLEEIKDNMGSFTDDIFLDKKQELYNKIYCIEEQIKQVDYLRENIKSKDKVKTKTLY